MHRGAILAHLQSRLGQGAIWCGQYQLVRGYIQIHLNRYFNLHICLPRCDKQTAHINFRTMCIKFNLLYSAYFKFSKIWMFFLVSKFFWLEFCYALDFVLACAKKETSICSTLHPTSLPKLYTLVRLIE